MTRFFGKLCAKHPELGGERYVSKYKCLGCNRDQVHARKKANPAKYAHLARDWKKANPARNAANQARYLAAKAQRVPKWADLEKIKEVYDAAKAAGMTVDHFYPLRGESVSGLHVHQNLRLLPGPENFAKGNRLP